MPQASWNDEGQLTQAASLTCRSTDIRGDLAAPPTRQDEIGFKKLTEDGRRHLHIAFTVDGRPAHFILDRDRIEQLKRFLGDA